MDEHYSDSAKLHQEIEIRLEGVWCKSNAMEITLPWDRVTQSTDTEEGIEMWFSSPALVQSPKPSVSEP